MEDMTLLEELKALDPEVLTREIALRYWHAGGTTAGLSEDDYANNVDPGEYTPAYLANDTRFDDEGMEAVLDSASWLEGEVKGILSGLTEGVADVFEEAAAFQPVWTHSRRASLIEAFAGFILDADVQDRLREDEGIEIGIPADIDGPHVILEAAVDEHGMVQKTRVDYVEWGI